MHQIWLRLVAHSITNFLSHTEWKNHATKIKKKKVEKKKCAQFWGKWEREREKPLKKYQKSLFSDRSAGNSACGEENSNVAKFPSQFHFKSVPLASDWLKNSLLRRNWMWAESVRRFYPFSFSHAQKSENFPFLRAENRSGIEKKEFSLIFSLFVTLKCANRFLTILTHSSV